MADVPQSSASLFDQGQALFTKVMSWYEWIPGSLVGLLARFSMFIVFWQSARTKVDGFSIASSTYYLFQNEYNVPLIPPDVAAVMATISEHVFSVLLLVGLASRLSATALLFMTLVIQLFVYPDAWAVHSTWGVALLYIMAYGPGALSLDHLVKGALGKE